MTNDELEMKPCPFCGGVDSDCFTEDGTGEGQYWYYVECRRCDSRTGFHETDGAAITAWNTRANLEKSDGALINEDTNAGISIKGD
ncbi:Lar family restriction alleviation protein [Erwinia endophytica]|uniref:Lar family restriction alleviation protein n=1 Tax=Erwinia endophytica TaxID=1563158 RepID=UPI00186B8590|nr:Lar family restriction alleviation protein [Erwinia endophytica]